MALIKLSFKYTLKAFTQSLSAVRKLAVSKKLLAKNESQKNVKEKNRRIINMPRNLDESDFHMFYH